MLSSRLFRTSGLFTKVTQGFAGGKKRKPTRKDLESYDLIVVGANLGGIFSRHFDHETHGHHPTMVCLDNSINQQYVLRTIYEQGRTSKTDYNIFSKLSISMETAHSEGIGIEKFNPEKNEVVLRNGRKIGYKYLVVAMGQADNWESIKGAEEAWADPEHPFFVPRDHITWKSSVNKPGRWHYNFKGGNAIFHIPPAPFHGEVECYNFFVSNEIWNWFNEDGRITWDNSNFTIINANDKFVQHFDKADRYIKDELAKRNVKVEYGLKLVEVRKDTQTAIFENIQTGQRTERPYNQMYSMIPTKPHQNLLESGLATKESNGFLDVDPETLQHRKYPNVFGIGDVNNLPTTKNFFGGFQQVHVVRNNLQRYIKGLPLNARYDGFSEAPLITGQGKMLWVQHYYNHRAGWLNLLGANLPLLETLTYQKFCKTLKKAFMPLYLFKTWGPPYGKFKKTFKELPGAQVQKAETQHVEPAKKVEH